MVSGRLGRAAELTQPCLPWMPGAVVTAGRACACAGVQNALYQRLLCGMCSFPCRHERAPGQFQVLAWDLCPLHRAAELPFPGRCFLTPGSVGTLHFLDRHELELAHSAGREGRRRLASSQALSASLGPAPVLGALPLLQLPGCSPGPTGPVRVALPATSPGPQPPGQGSGGKHRAAT